MNFSYVPFGAQLRTNGTAPKLRWMFRSGRLGIIFNPLCGFGKERAFIYARSNKLNNYINRIRFALFCDRANGVTVATAAPTAPVAVAVVEAEDVRDAADVLIRRS